MEHTVEKLSGNKVKISFKAPAADFEEAVEKAYLKMRGQISVPGFRKGKAPRKLIERMYGAGVFYEDALEILFPLSLIHISSEFTVPIEGGGGYADGYDVQIAKLIAEGLGKELVIVKTEWDGLPMGVMSGAFDAIIAVSYTHLSGV